MSEPPKPATPERGKEPLWPLIVAFLGAIIVAAGRWGVNWLEGLIAGVVTFAIIYLLGSLVARALRK